MHYFSKITTINLTHGNCCNNFINHGNSPCYNLVNNLLIVSDEHCNMLKTKRNKTQWTTIWEHNYFFILQHTLILLCVFL
jgi:hypothetical protein